MLSDLSNIEGALRDPLIPKEAALKRQINLHRGQLDDVIHNTLGLYGTSRQSVQEYVSSNISTRCFTRTLKAASHLTPATSTRFLSTR